jgi:pimeloyl-ACP methyl ester carboxylesterase
MHKGWFCAACIGVLVCARAQMGAAEATTPLDVYGHLPSLEDVIISPDGNQIAFLKTAGDQRTLMVVQPSPYRVMAALNVGETKLRSVRWIDDDNLLLTLSGAGLMPFGWSGGLNEWYKLDVFNISKRKITPISFYVGPSVKTFDVVVGEVAVRRVGGHSMLYAPGWYATDHALPGLFSFEIPGEQAKLLSRGTEMDTHWLMDESGQIAAAFVYYDSKKQWQILARKNGQLATVAGGKAEIDVPQMIGFNADGTAIIVSFMRNGEVAWLPLNVKDGSWGPPIERGAAFSNVIEDPRSGRIIGGQHAIGDNQYVFFDNELQAHWNAILRAFPNEQVQLVSHSDDYSKVVVQVFGAKDGYVYALYDWFEHRAIMLGQVYKGLTDVAEVRPISYTAADGLPIPGFLTLPRGIAEKNLPLIVLPHGGPAASDTQHFDWLAQALAAQGYAVLQPNYRGSTITNRFVEAGFGEWGRKMQSDLSDGVRYLVKQDIVDPKRVCIVGESYGGYAALAGVTLDPGVYRCAVSVAGVSDLRRLRAWTAKNRLGIVQRYWDRYMGVSDANDPALVAISPIEHVNAVTVPILLIHGRDDTVVPFEQSDVMQSALSRAGKSSQLVTLKHEDHWLSNSATRQQMLEATVEFLKTNNPPN